MKYHRPKLAASGWSEWFPAVRKGYRLACCDCGLVHVIDFALMPWARGKRIVLRARRNARATAGRRRGRKDAR